jgi:hypothetical protein
VSEYEAKHGKDALVFISTGLFWNCHTHDYPKWREFSTLCGINSVFGLQNAKTPILLRRSMITARQLGYKTPKIMKLELANRKDQKPLTAQQMRDSLDILEAAGNPPLIQRCLASRTNMYFSTGNTHQELQDAVKKIIVARAKIRVLREHDRKVFQGQS